MVNEIALPESYFVMLLALSGMNQVYAVPTGLAFGHYFYQRQYSRRIAANQEGAAKQHIISAKDAEGVWRTALKECPTQVEPPAPCIQVEPQGTHFSQKIYKHQRYR